MSPTRSKESNENLIYNEVRNLSRRLNELQSEINSTIQVLKEAAQDCSLDIEQLTLTAEQLRSRLEYLETILKDQRRAP